MKITLQNLSDFRFKRTLECAISKTIDTRVQYGSFDTVKPLINQHMDSIPSQYSINTAYNQTSSSTPCYAWGWTWGNGRTAAQYLNDIAATLDSQPQPNWKDMKIETLEISQQKFNVDKWFPKKPNYNIDTPKKDFTLNYIKKWTQEEMDKLREAYYTFGKDYKAIARALGFKNEKKVRYKLKHLVPESINRHHRWTKEEDELLLKVKMQMPNNYWSEIQAIYFHDINSKIVENRWFKLIGEPITNKYQMVDRDIYKFILCRELNYSEDELVKEFKGRDLEHLRSSMIDKLKPYLTDYRTSYLEHMRKPEQPVMETLSEVRLSTTTLNNIDEASKQEYFQFIPLLKLALEKKHKFTKEKFMKSIICTDRGRSCNKGVEPGSRPTCKVSDKITSKSIIQKDINREEQIKKLFHIEKEELQKVLQKAREQSLTSKKLN